MLTFMAIHPIITEISLKTKTINLMAALKTRGQSGKVRTLFFLQDQSGSRATLLASMEYSQCCFLNTNFVEFHPALFHYHAEWSKMHRLSEGRLKPSILGSPERRWDSVTTLPKICSATYFGVLFSWQKSWTRSLHHIVLYCEDGGWENWSHCKPRQGWSNMNHHPIHCPLLSL